MSKDASKKSQGSYRLAATHEGPPVSPVTPADAQKRKINNAVVFRLYFLGWLLAQ